MDVARKLMLLQYVKAEFQRRSRSFSTPFAWVEKLPPPAKLAREFPAVHAAVYTCDNVPVAPPRETETSVLQLDMSYGCRGGNRTSTIP